MFLFSCNLRDKDSKDDVTKMTDNNVLLAEKVEVKDLIEIENKDNPEWLSGFNRSTFFENIFSKVFSGEFTKCYYNFSESDTGRFSIVGIKERMGATDVINKESNTKDTIANELYPNLSQLKYIYFFEEWHFDKETLIFSKFVNAWSPVRVYFKDGHYKKEDARKRLIFIVKKDSLSDPRREIAKDFTYVFEFDRSELSSVFFRKGLDKFGFLKFILDNLQSGKLKAYDPIYLVDKSKREFTTEQLKNYAGINFNYEEFNDEVIKLIFIEDWYFDDKTFNFAKKVKGIGFIAKRYQNGEREEKILFFIFTNHK